MGALVYNPRRMDRACLVTATDSRFLPGAFTTVGSFLRHHPRFDGDVVVLHDGGLSPESRGYLESLSDRVRFEPVARRLRDRLTRLEAATKFSAARLTDFYSLEAFRLTGYRKVLFCDADLLFRAPVDELFDSDADLLCCGEIAHVRGLRRDRATFAMTSAEGLDRTFNCGFMLIDGRLLGPRPYADLLALVTPETWRATETPHTDGFLLNRGLAGRQTLVGWTYNYLLGWADDIRTRHDLRWNEAKVLHYSLPHKPWLPERLMRSPVGELGAHLLPAYRLWYDAWLDLLAAAHLRSVGRARRAGRRVGPAGPDHGSEAKPRADRG